MPHYRDPTGENHGRRDRAGRPRVLSPELKRALEQSRHNFAKAGNVHTFTGLYLGDRRVAAMLVPGKFGLQWLVHEDDRANTGGRKWVPYAGLGKSRVQADLGLRERPELASADADIDGDCVVTVRTGDKWGRDATLKFPGALPK